MPKAVASRAELGDMFLGDVRRELFADSRDGVKKDVVERLTLWLGPVAFFALAAGGLYVSAKDSLAQAWARTSRA
jgi:hypothetical protein